MKGRAGRRARAAWAAVMPRMRQMNDCWRGVQFRQFIETVALGFVPGSEKDGSTSI
jgi:hypothetical protein